MASVMVIVRDRCGRPVACVLFGSAAWKCADRDTFLGWDGPTRERNLQRLTNNTRFLIPGWVQVPHLASHVLQTSVNGDLRRKLNAPTTGARSWVPDIVLSIDPECPDELLVFLGLALLEKVPNLREHPVFKMLLARLHNGGVSGQRLTGLFGVARSTLLRWGRALKSGDLDRIRDAFSGQGAARKVTPEMERYVRDRFRDLYGPCRDYSKVIRGELARYFKTSVSSERLRWIWREMPPLQRWTFAVRWCRVLSRSNVAVGDVPPKPGYDSVNLKVNSCAIARHAEFSVSPHWSLCAPCWLQAAASKTFARWSSAAPR